MALIARCLYEIGHRVKKIYTKDITKDMYFNIVCYCGAPVCGLYRYFVLAKLLTFQDQSDNLEAAVEQL